MALLSVSHLTFAYEGSYDPVFQDISFQVDTAWHLGLIGRNGRGKTTLFRLLQGQYEYQGTIASPERFTYFPYRVADPTQFARMVMEQICPGIPEWRVLRELNLLAVRADVLDCPFEMLSNGEQTKILLAAMFLQENHFLLIDEPTNHLDLPGRQLLSKYLKTKSGFLLVSHDRAFLDGCIDHVLSLNKAGVEVQKGNFSSWFANKQRQDAFETAENEKLKKEVKRLGKAAGEKAAWSARAEKRKIGFDPSKTEKSIGRRVQEGAKSKKLMKRAKAMEERQQKAMEEKTKLLKNVEYASELKLEQLPTRSDRLVALRAVSPHYGTHVVCRKVSFEIHPGDRVALAGANGCGKSTLLKLICGQAIETEGELFRCRDLVISCVPQDASFLQGDLTAYAAHCGIDESLFKAILRKLDFQRVQFEKDMRDFSGGQKKKVLIARSLCEKANLHIWDEPMNFIDVFSRVQLENLILQYRPTLLFVEHDKIFCEHVATRTVLVQAADGDAGESILPR
jgi:lincosamide and streptogramin A transport system ATP-binding/permease protein